jgi:hypothetical protein
MRKEGHNTCTSTHNTGHQVDDDAMDGVCWRRYEDKKCKDDFVTDTQKKRFLKMTRLCCK